jgi:hypothetical protein
MHRSSIGLGHYPFTVGRGVRFPYGVPNGWRAELVTAPDCKSGVFGHTGFESLATHHIEVHYSQQQRVSAERTRSRSTLSRLHGRRLSSVLQYGNQLTVIRAPYAR